jgi:hypothetical protein
VGRRKGATLVWVVVQPSALVIVVLQNVLSKLLQFKGIVMAVYALGMFCVNAAMIVLKINLYFRHVIVLCH